MTAVRDPLGRLVDPRVSSASPEVVDAFVEEAFAAFDRAAEGWGEADHLRVAGRVVRVRYAAPELRRRFRPALVHLADAAAADAVDAGLTICCWDGRATTVKLPAPPWREVDFLGDARIRGHIAGPRVATYDADGRHFQLFDRPGRRALFHVADGRTLPDWHDRSPFRPFVSLWADDESLALLHGATVGADGAAVVLAGGSGSGKSTTALSCLQGGMDFLGDDACLVDAAAGTVSSIYGRAKIEPDTATRLGSLDDLGGMHTDTGGATVVSPVTVTGQASLRAVLLVAVSGQSRTVVHEPLGPEEAMAALVETLRVENKGLTPGALAALATVVAAVPVRPLALGTDLAQVVATVRGVVG
ncbi:MAG: hypothetical protein QOE93_660 [Actinomycetota bacterium]|nr:hypothetical protein [Actinomycetota bacterium]